MEVEQLLNIEISGSAFPCQEFLRILAEILANSVVQDLGSPVPI